MSEQRTVDLLRNVQRQATKVYVDPALPGVEFHFSPVTLADYKAVDEGGKGGLDTSVAMIVHKARKADGSPHFTAGDKHYLMSEVPAEVLNRLADAMNAVTLSEGAAKEAEAAVKADTFPAVPAGAGGGVGEVAG